MLYHTISAHYSLAWPIVQVFPSATHPAQVPGTAGPVGAMLTSYRRLDVMVTQPGCRRILTDVITCSSTLKRSCCGAATAPGHAADQGQLDKERDWSAMAEAEGDLFFALPVECGGRLGHTTLAFLRRLSVAHGEVDLSAIAAFMTYSTQQTQLTSKKGVARLILARPTSRSALGTPSRRAYRVNSIQTRPGVLIREGQYKTE